MCMCTFDTVQLNMLKLFFFYYLKYGYYVYNRILG